jgi:predicted nucleic acid-binding protein
MGAVTLDADVIIAFLYPLDAQHQAAVELLDSLVSPDDSVLIPASVYSEILVGPERAGTVEVIDRFIRGSAATIAVIDQTVAKRAAQLRAAIQHLRLPDALALATALERDARFITLDRRLQRIYESLG